MRVLYPDLVYGAISSSGVTHATVVDWRYFDIIRQYAPQDCMAQVVKAIDEVDRLLERSNKTRNAVKALFGLSGLSYDPDFASLLSVRPAAVCLVWTRCSRQPHDRAPWEDGRARTGTPLSAALGSPGSALRWANPTERR